MTLGMDEALRRSKKMIRPQKTSREKPSDQESHCQEGSSEKNDAEAEQKTDNAAEAKSERSTLIGKQPMGSEQGPKLRVLVQQPVQLSITREKAKRLSATFFYKVFETAACCREKLFFFLCCNEF